MYEMKNRTSAIVADDQISSKEEMDTEYWTLRSYETIQLEADDEPRLAQQGFKETVDALSVATVPVQRCSGARAGGLNTLRPSRRGCHLRAHGPPDHHSIIVSAST